MEKILGRVQMYYMKIKKSPTHIHFLTTNFIDSRQFFALWFCDFPVFYMRIMQSENFAANIHTHYRQSETAPLYTRIIREKNFAPRYIWGLRCVWNRWAIDWVLISLRSFVSCFVYAVIVWIRTFLLIGWCQNLVVKSVIKLYKFIVKMWLCICNCMCICVCIWYWLWFCYRLDSVVIRL